MRSILNHYPAKRYKKYVSHSWREAKKTRENRFSLGVAQIARSLSRAMKLNEDLAEVVSLAHDLGHPPFGHNGEKSLNVLQPVNP